MRLSHWGMRKPVENDTSCMKTKLDFSLKRILFHSEEGGWTSDPIRIKCEIFRTNSDKYTHSRRINFVKWLRREILFFFSSLFSRTPNWVIFTVKWFCFFPHLKMLWPKSRTFVKIEWAINSFWFSDSLSKIFLLSVAVVWEVIICLSAWGDLDLPSLFENF